MGGFCVPERWCRSLLVCKCSSSCLSWRCAWGKLKIGRAHLWASCFFTACGTVFALSPSLSQSGCCYPPLSLSVFLLFLDSESGLVCLARPVLAWKTWNRTPLPFNRVHYPTWRETRTLWHSAENVSLPWVSDPIILEAQKFMFIPHKWDPVVKMTINNKVCLWRILEKCQTIEYSKVGRTSSMPQHSWSFIFELFSSIITKKFFASQQTNFSSQIWQWSFWHFPKIKFLHKGTLLAIL